MHMLLFKIGGIGGHVTLSFSKHVMTVSKAFYFKMADANAVFFFDVNFMKKKRHRIKACKKKNLSSCQG